MRKWSNVHEPLKDRTFYGKKNLFFNFWGVDFLVPKSGGRREKQPVLGPGKPMVMMDVKVSKDK